MPVGKVTQVSQTKTWYGELSPGPPESPLYGQYIYGIAGERFFREIRDNTRIMGTKCGKCNLTYLPPRIYCEQCFEEMKDWCEIKNRGEIYTYTLSYEDLDGLRLEKPLIIALVKFEGVYGGIVHKVEEVGQEKVGIGMKVEAVFKEKKEREGSILDIKYFKPI